MLEFHDKYIYLNEKSKLALRFNSVDANGIIHSPIMPQDFSWPKDIVCVSESEPEINGHDLLQSKGIYAVPVEKLSRFNIVSEAMKRRSDIVIYLVEYFPSDLIFSYLNEIAVRQCNIVQTFDVDDIKTCNFDSVLERYYQKRGNIYNSYARDLQKVGFDGMKMRDENKLNLQRFIHNELKEFSSIHGIKHFVNVDNFGQMLSAKTGADINVVRWFAYLHDFCRHNDGTDIEHGARAAAYIDQIRHTYLSELDTCQISMLRVACRWHTEANRLNIPTIDVCFDADRLDLPRVGIRLNPDRMATEYGREFAKNDYCNNVTLSLNWMDELC